MVFEVMTRESTNIAEIDLMNSFDSIPILGYSLAVQGEAVWKLSYQSGINVGRVVQVNRTHLRLDGMPGFGGDSGGPLCLGERFDECTLVGMVVAGNDTTDVVEAVSFPHLAMKMRLSEVFPESLKRLPRVREELAELKRALEKLEMEKEKEKEKSEREKAELKLEKEKEKEKLEKEKAELKLEKEKAKSKLEKEKAELKLEKAELKAELQAVIAELSHELDSLKAAKSGDEQCPKR